MRGCHGTYVIHGACWQASHALRSEYTTVLHLHKFPSSTSGPVYEAPDSSGGMENTVRGKDTKWYEGDHSLPPLHVAIKCAATVHAF